MAKSDATPQTNKPPKDAPLFMWAGDAGRTVIPVVYTAGRRKRTEDGHEAKPATEVLLVWDGRASKKKT